MPDALPVLDLSRLDRGDAEAAAFRTDLRRAAHEVGFFELVGHGVPDGLIDEILGLSRRFFALPEQDKLAIENRRSPQFRGYTRVGGERTHGDVDWREQIDIAPERPTVDPGEDVPDYLRLEGPNLWPDALPELRPVVERWQAELGRVALRLLRAWSEALGAPADAFDEAFATRPFTLLKIVRYPGATADDRTQGVGAHRDGGVLTLLLVEPGKAGLQVEHAGEWIDVVPRPGAFVVNIGEMLELATGGYLRATLHRVVAPAAGTDRISVPFFFNPALDTRMPRIPLAPELAAEARGLSADPTHSPILDVYGDNALRYRLRAHPDVAAIHHPDLVARKQGSAG
ncbi:2-oxoglutarate and iron-dependent oxygenase domain-containing protein [Amnibacterium sp. CER49]|uniref:isopenicillin N synthase family dioxygenase n=1 Tax=Amnibacterium sp. CER49 TaxID=3039161 RepID=UPI00244786A1|nr:2-oxoglutarate and iron-dependent oxygenase domain-containing protein [Amnibacterium sp. CER49]MDH2444013.1 2-oxoglutarate and iron-dependent oxygenase domain-containing protein [Amnibacterium sp. CER49]